MQHFVRADAIAMLCLIVSCCITWQSTDVLFVLCFALVQVNPASFNTWFAAPAGSPNQALASLVCCASRVDLPDLAPRALARPELASWS
jgi:hypothetical protein